VLVLIAMPLEFGAAEATRTCTGFDGSLLPFALPAGREFWGRVAAWHPSAQLRWQ
jgi:hypothetical protein